MSKSRKNIRSKIAPSAETIGFVSLMLVMLILFSVLTGFSFLRPNNIINIIADAVIPCIFALGMGVIFAASGFDLSLGHIASMSALLTAYLMNPGIGINPFIAILIGLGVAVIIGGFSGIVVSRFGISSFIVTLGVQFIVVGIRQKITGGRSVYIGHKGFKLLAGTTLGISNLIFILLAVALVCHIVMERTAFGRKIHFIGSNIDASRFKGIDVKNYTLIVFIIGAVLAAFGGMLFAARAGAVQINSVDSKLLDAITIAVFSSVIYKRYRAHGIVLVAILISMIGTGMSMIGIKTEWIDFVKGLILMVSIFISYFNIDMQVNNFKRRSVEECQA